MSSTSLEHCQRYAALAGSELSMTFNFHHLKVLIIPVVKNGRWLNQTLCAALKTIVPATGNKECTT